MKDPNSVNLKCANSNSLFIMQKKNQINEAKQYFGHNNFLTLNLHFYTKQVPIFDTEAADYVQIKTW